MFWWKYIYLNNQVRGLYGKIFAWGLSLNNYFPGQTKQMRLLRYLCTCHNPFTITDRFCGLKHAVPRTPQATKAAETIGWQQMLEIKAFCKRGVLVLSNWLNSNLNNVFWSKNGGHCVSVCSGRLLHPHPDPLEEIQDGVDLDQPQNGDFFCLLKIMIVFSWRRTQQQKY